MVILCGFAAGLLWLDTPEARYQEYPCQYRLTYAQEGPVEVAVFGNSRSMLAINAHDLRNSMAARGLVDPDAVFYKFSRSWRAQEHQYIFIRDFLERHRVKLLLLEYNNNPGRRYHPRLQFQGRLTDLAEVSLIDTHRDVVIRLTQIFRWILERGTLRIELLLTGKWKNLSESPVIPAVTTDCTNFIQKVRPEKNLSTRKKSEGKMEKLVSWNLDSGDERVTTYYTQKIIDLAREQGARVRLFYVPAYLTGWMPPEFIAEVEEFFGVSFFSPPRDLVLTLNQPGYFRDPTHMLMKGNRLYTEWLVSSMEGQGRPK